MNALKWLIRVYTKEMDRFISGKEKDLLFTYKQTNKQKQVDDNLRGNKIDLQSQDRWIDPRSIVTAVCPSISFQTTVRTTGSQTPPVKHPSIFHSNHIIWRYPISFPVLSTLSSKNRYIIHIIRLYLNLKTSYNELAYWDGTYSSVVIESIGLFRRCLMIYRIKYVICS